MNEVDDKNYYLLGGRNSDFGLDQQYVYSISSLAVGDS